jgi:hypothetical protein
MGGTSRVTEDSQARFCERLGVKFPGRTSRRRLVHSVGNQPHQDKSQGPVAWIVGRKETEFRESIDKAIHGMVSESLGRNESERIGGTLWSAYSALAIRRAQGKKIQRAEAESSLRVRRALGYVTLPVWCHGEAVYTYANVIDCDGSPRQRAQFLTT